jgi:L-fuconolactonase
MRIDAHHHLWDLTVRDQPWTADLPVLRRSFSVDDLRPSLAAHSIDGTVLVQTICVKEETPEMLALAAREPAIRGVVGWVDLTAPDVAGELARLRSLPGGELLVGIRHQVQEEPDPAFLRRADVRRGLGAVGEAGLVYDLVVRSHQLPAVVDTVRALPELPFVLDHAGKPVIAGLPAPDWLEAIHDLAALQNITVKLSGLTTEAPPGWTAQTLAPYVDALFTSFGAGRIMFGSDWPVCLLAGGYDAAVDVAEALAAQLSSDERRLIFGEVAARFYGLTL